jgi:hypothetical protein
MSHIKTQANLKSASYSNKEQKYYTNISLTRLIGTSYYIHRSYSLNFRHFIYSLLMWKN